MNRNQMPVPSRLPTVEHLFIDTGGPRIHSAELPGSRPPLVLLHGIGMDWRVWQGVSRRLHDHFHLYLLDLRGHGESDKPERGYTLGDYAADVEDVIDRLELERAAVLGSSLGGMVAAVVEAPVDVVSHRILVDPPLTGGPIRDQRMFENILRLKHESVETLANYLGSSNPGMSSFFLKTMAEMWERAADGVIVEMLEHRRDYFAINRSLENDEAATLIMRGDRRLGGVLSAEEADRAMELLPNGSVVEVEEAGHAIHAYQPAQFVRLVADFVLGEPNGS